MSRDRAEREREEGRALAPRRFQEMLLEGSQKESPKKTTAAPPAYEPQASRTLWLVVAFCNAGLAAPLPCNRWRPLQCWLVYWCLMASFTRYAIRHQVSNRIYLPIVVGIESILTHLYLDSIRGRRFVCIVSYRIIRPGRTALRTNSGTNL